MNTSHYDKMAQRSLEVRGFPYYGNLTSLGVRYFKHFRLFQRRSAKSGLHTDFPRDLPGFVDFINYIGPIPEGMKYPSLGRKDHNIGYIRGNFAWQEMRENQSESAIRNQSWKNRPTKQDKLLKYLQESTFPLDINKVASDFDYKWKKNLYAALRVLGYRYDKQYVLERHGVN